MDKEQLLTTCRSLISDIESELIDNDMWNILEYVSQSFVTLNGLELKIDVLSLKEEKELDEIVFTLSAIDIDKIKSSKKIIKIVDKLPHLLADLKSKIILGKIEEIMDLLQNMRSLLEILANKI